MLFIKGLNNIFLFFCRTNMMLKSKLFIFNLRGVLLHRGLCMHDIKSVCVTSKMK